VREIINKSKLTLLHCVSAYPANLKDINLPRINKLKEINKSVGYSGHLIGINDAIAALNYNPVFIEKHFTLDNKLPGRDNKFALLPAELKQLVDYKNSLGLMSKFKGKNFQKVELDMRNNYRGRWSK
jgi:sialic acid synthase SpsE